MPLNENTGGLQHSWTPISFSTVVANWGPTKITNWLGSISTQSSSFNPIFKSIFSNGNNKYPCRTLLNTAAPRGECLKVNQFILRRNFQHFAAQKVTLVFSQLQRTNWKGKNKGGTTLLCIGGSYIIEHNCVWGSVQSGVIGRSDLGTWPATLGVKSSKGQLGLKWFALATPRNGVWPVCSGFKTMERRLAVSSTGVSSITALTFQSMRREIVTGHEGKYFSEPLPLSDHNWMFTHEQRCQRTWQRLLKLLIFA